MSFVYSYCSLRSLASTGIIFFITPSVSGFRVYVLLLYVYCLSIIYLLAPLLSKTPLCGFLGGVARRDGVVFILFFYHLVTFVTLLLIKEESLEKRGHTSVSTITNSAPAGITTRPEVLILTSSADSISAISADDIVTGSLSAMCVAS
jgi:hypothetical protein